MILSLPLHPLPLTFPLHFSAVPPFACWCQPAADANEQASSETRSKQPMNRTLHPPDITHGHDYILSWEIALTLW